MLVYQHPLLGSRKIELANEELLVKKLQEKGFAFKRLKKVPTLRQLEKWMDSGICPTPDGCRVEPDGKCCHGWESWLLIAGMI